MKNLEYAAAEAPILNHTSTYTITFTHHFRVRIRFSLIIGDIKNIFSAAEVIFLVFLAKYVAAEAPRFSC